jgi:hypothetical protein
VLKKKIIRAIDDFFQYKKSGDDEILDEVLDKIEYKDKYVIIDGEEKIKVDKKKDVVGVFLANIPYIILGPGEIHDDLLNFSNSNQEACEADSKDLIVG